MPDQINQQIIASWKKVGQKELDEAEIRWICRDAINELGNQGSGIRFDLDEFHLAYESNSRDSK